MFRAVLYADLDFTRAPWDTVSPACKDLVQSLLQRGPAQRLTAVEALKHRYHMCLITIMMMMMIMTMIEMIVIMIMIVVLLSRRHRKDSPEAHTVLNLIGVHMLCIVVLACHKSLLPAADTSLCNTSGGGVPCMLRLIIPAAESKDWRHVNMTMHCMSTPNKMTPVCASELSFLCLLDSGTSIIILDTITLISVIIVIISIVPQHVTGTCTQHDAEHHVNAQLKIGGMPT